MTDASSPENPEPSAPETPRPAPQRPQRPQIGDAPTPPIGFPDAPAIRRIGFDAITSALAAGWHDFRQAPSFGLFFGGVFTVAGLILLASFTVWDTPWTILPLAIAFPLTGPFVAVGLYEVSRRLAAGEPLNWGEILGVVFAQKDRQLAWMGMVILFVFWIWAYQVRLLLALFLGSAAFSSTEGFMSVVTGTENGLMFLGFGTAIGAVLALVLFSLTVISMPLLVDRDVDVVTAMVTSVAAVRRSPVPMVLWGAAVTLLMIAALIPAFVGLLVILPVLGHATWHLYDRVIVRS
ncbi:MAG: DUF2189 domain-containing protein [Pseudomonadota bacterium]